MFDIFEIEGNHIRAFAILACGYFNLQLLIHWNTFTKFVGAPLPMKARGQVFGRIPLPKLEPRLFQLVGAGLWLGMAAIALGFFPRFAAVLCIPLYFLYFGQILQIKDIRRKTNLIPIVLTAFAFSPGLSEPLTVNTSPWPLIAIQIAVAMMYFSAAVSKLLKTGLKWSDGHTLQTHLLIYYWFEDIKLAYPLARYRWLCAILSGVTLFAEAMFWLIIPFPELTLPFLIVIVGFHAASSLLMRIHYLKFFGMCLFAFVTGPALTLWFHWQGGA